MKQSTLWRRAVALLCALVLMVTGVPMAEASMLQGPTITVNSTSVSQGGTAYVYVYGNNLEDLGALQFTLTYDETVFTLVDVYAHGMEMSSVNTNTAGEARYGGMDLSGVTSSQVHLMTVELRAASDAELGDYDLGLLIGFAQDINKNSVTFEKAPGTVTVTKAQPLYASFSGSVSPYTVEAGETVTYTLSSWQLSGMAAGQFSFTYDSDLLTFQEAELLYGLDLDGRIYSVNKANQGNVMISWMIGEGTARTGQLLRLTFKAVETASGDASITFTPMTMSSEDKQAITASPMTTNLTITEKQVVETDPAFWLKVPEVTQTNEPFTVIAAVEGRSGLAAANFSVSYNVDVLECLSVTPVSGLDEGTNVMAHSSFSNGLIQFTLMCNGGISEDMDLVAITFQSKENRTVSTTLTTSVYKPINDSSVVIPLDCQSASMDITVPTFTVTFLDHDGTELDTQTVPYLGNATAPDVGGKDNTDEVHYVHNGWDKDFSSIVVDLTVTAQYDAVKHEFKTWTQKDQSSHVSTCSGCGIEQVESHQWSNISTLDMTNHTYSCTACSAEQAAPHNWEDHICSDCGQEDAVLTVSGTTATLQTAFPAGCNIVVAAYSSDGQMLTSDLYSWTGTELTFTVPEGDLIQVFFLDSNWSPLRPQIPI